jgi:hypothetical protein
MGRIGDSAFVQDLVRVVPETEGTTYIHDNAIKALNGIDEAGHEELFEAIKERITNEIDILALLEHPLTLGHSTLPCSSGGRKESIFWNHLATASKESGT